MRILSIRGKNLASLQGEFEVRLDAGPLAEAGVFAIVGRTGSGKSTLLDALCLALFNKTPRLSAQGGAKVGHAEGELLASYDVRGLLRKGTAEGHAEVDFEGADGRTYTARWSVRRAHRRVDKRLQDVERELRLTATAEVLASGKRECDAAIPEKLGLDFDQFRRAVLLAQGDFARFLQAKPEERAALLELMTGTEIYARLSMAAHARKKAAEDAQAKLESSAGAFAPLSDEARTELEARRDTLERDDAAAQASVDALAVSRRWYADREQLRALIAEADALERAASEVWQDAAGLRAEHARVTAAQPGEARLQAVDAARDAESKAHGERTAARAEAATASAARDDARAAEATAKEKAEARGAALRRAQPDIDAARELDLRQARSQEALDAAAEQLADARGRVQEIAAEASAHETALEENEAALRAADAVLDALREDASVLGEWAQHERTLTTLIATETELASSNRARRALDQRQLRLDEDRARASEAERRAEETFRRREAKLADARDGARLARQVDTEAVRARIVDFDRDLAELEQTERAILRASEELDRLRGATTTLDAEIGALEEALATLADEQPELERRLDDAERMHELARAALSLEDERARLEEGDPCPLCGALEHPFARSGAPATLLTESETQLRAARDAHRAHQAQRASKEGALESKREAREAQLRSIAERALALEGDRRTGASLRARLGEDPVAVRARVEGLCRGLTFAEALRRSRDEELDRATEAHADAVNEQQRARTHADLLQTDLAELATQRSGLEAREETLAAQRAGLLAELDDAFGSTAWRAELASDAMELIERWRARATEWAGAQQRHREAEARRAHLRQILDDANRRLATAERERDARASEAAKARARQAEIEAARGALLGGRDANEYEATLRRAAEEASGEAARLAARAADVAEAAGRAESAAQAADRRVTETLRALQTAREELDAWLTDAGFTRPDLEALLHRPATWREETGRKLEALKRSLADARVKRDERRERLDAHEAQPPRHEEAGLSERLAEAQAFAAGAREALVEVKGQLHADDRNRAKTASIATELAAARAEAERWGQLSALIGSSDGKRFRLFAQGLTLDILLGYANQQLASLHPRYQLQRVPGEDLELQVIDREMGDEIRSLHSLSGGETFLASLALALGLSALSSEKTPIESLFIDEGFGTLDPESLELVLEVLDQLHATGRQVGVISHVEAVAERLAAQVEVVDHGGGRSQVVVGTAALAA